MEFNLPEFIIAQAKEVYHEDPLKKSRITKCVWARMAIANKLKESMKIKEIYQLLDIDNATVHHYFKKHADLMETDKEYIGYYNAFRRETRLGINREDYAMMKIKEYKENLNNCLLSLGFTGNEIKTLLQTA